MRDEITAVVHGLGGFDLEVGAVAQLVDLGEDGFKLLTRKQVRLLTAADGDEEEDVPHDDLELFKEVAEVVEVVHVVTADGGVDLDG